MPPRDADTSHSLRIAALKADFRSASEKNVLPIGSQLFICQYL